MTQQPSVRPGGLPMEFTPFVSRQTLALSLESTSARCSGGDLAIPHTHKLTSNDLLYAVTFVL